MSLAQIMEKYSKPINEESSSSNSSSSSSNSSSSSSSSTSTSSKPKETTNTQNQPDDEVVVISGEEKIEVVEIIDNGETSSIDVNDGEKIELQVDSIGEIIQIAIVNGEVRITLVNKGVDYAINRDEVFPLLIGQRQVFLGIRDLANNNVILTLGLNKDRVTEEVLGGIAKARAVTYVLMIVAVLLVFVIGTLLYRYLKTAKAKTPVSEKK